MTTRSFEGCHDIEAAKQRLAMANVWKASAAEMVLLAMKQLESAESEVQQAEFSLKEAYKRWEVNSVLDYSESESEEERDNHVKSRTMVVSKDSSDGDESETDPAVSSSGLLNVVVEVPNNDDKNNEDAANSVSTLRVEQIMVEGGGVPGLNGIYKRYQTINDDLPLCFDKSVSVWCKSGFWEGDMVENFIFRDKFSQRWSIACQTESELVFTYSNH